MTDASILIPTFRHAALLPWSIRSALDQEHASVEVLVVGDGVEDATREVIASFADDPRVRFFDFPKGPRNGEAYRHAALETAVGHIVCYLCDDIDGVQIYRRPTHADERGTACEIYDLRWGLTDEPLVYAYYVTIGPGQIKGWVLHRVQTNRVFVYDGVARIVLYDARTDSASFGRMKVFHFGSHDRALVFIPPGVYHALQRCRVRQSSDGAVPARRP